jgi:hypothetical protein
MMVGSGTPAGGLPEWALAGLSRFFDFTALDQGLRFFLSSCRVVKTCFRVIDLAKQLTPSTVLLLG